MDCSTLPLSVEGITAEDCREAQAILKDDKLYMARYLREEPKVALGLVPVRNEEGKVLDKVPPKKRRVICSGAPIGCMIAFMSDGNLYVGWSKRSNERDLEAEREAREKDPYFLKPIYVEKTAFSKNTAKETAILRGLKDTVSFNGKHAVSAISGVIPHSIEKELHKFVAEAERVFGEKAINVGYPELMPTAKRMVAGMSSGAI